MKLFNRYGHIIYENSRATTVAALVEEAIKLGRPLRGVSLCGAEAALANWQNMYMPEADLRKANLSGAYLFGAYFERADLRGANLYCTVIRNASFSYADLRDADLREAVLFGCSCIWNGANLRGARFRGAKVLNWESVLHPLCFVLPDKIRIGCQTRTVAEWRRLGPRIAAEYGYTKRDIELYRSHVADLARAGARFVRILRQKGARV